MPRSSDRDAALLLAAWQGDAARVEAILSEGGDANACDDVGATPLIRAAYNGHVDVVELLLARGANLHAQDREGHTALFYATFGGHAPAVRLLVHEGIDVNGVDRNGRTALLVAESLGYLDIVRELRRAGAMACVPQPIEPSPPAEPPTGSERPARLRPEARPETRRQDVQPLWARMVSLLGRAYRNTIRILIVLFGGRRG